MRKNDENIDIRSKSAKRLDRILMSLLLGSIITVAVGTGIFINKQVSNIEDDINESKQNFNTFVVEQNLKDTEQDEKISDLKQKAENFDISISLNDTYNDTYVADSGLKDAKSSNYVVKTGDTLSEIVFDKYGRYSLNAIKAVAYLNNISNVNRIWAGQSLIIPTQEQIEQLRMNGDLDFYVDSWVMDKVEEAPVEKGIIFRANPFIEEEVAEDVVSVAEENQVESVKSRVSDEPELVVNNMFEEFTPAKEISEPVAEEVVEETAPVVEEEAVVEEAPAEEVSEPVAEEVVEETAPAVEEEAVVEEALVEEISEPVAEEVVEETAPVVEETLNFDLLKEYFDDGDNYIPTLNTENIDDMFKLESEFMKGFLLSESMNNISEEQELVEETESAVEEEAVVEEAPAEEVSEPVAEDVVEETEPAVEEAVVEEAPAEEVSEAVAEEIVEETAPAVEEETVVEEVPAEEVSEPVAEEVVEETAPAVEEEVLTEEITEPVAEDVVEETAPAVKEEAVVEEVPSEEVSEPVVEDVVEETAPAVKEEAVVEEVPAEEVIEPVIEENTNPIVEEIEDIVVENDEYMNNFYNSTNYIGFKEDEGLEEHLIEMQRKSEMEKIKKSHEKEVFTNLFEKTR